MLEVHYTALKNEREPEVGVAHLVSEFRRTGKDADTVDLLVWMYDGYLRTYGHDDDLEVIAVEYRFQVPLGAGFELKGVIDLVARDRATGLVWVYDHKSCANLPKSKELDLDDQFGLYLWGLRQLGHKPFGCVYSSARTKRNLGDFPDNIKAWETKKAAGTKVGARPEPQPLSGRFDRYLMARTDQELETVAFDALATARSMYHPDDVAERHTNSDTCRWRCDFTEACLIGRKYGPERERQFLLDVGFRQDYRRH